MVVSTILLTALAPITGALFGASYGTSIRIGYEIIFPALFGDLLKEQNKRLASGSPQQADAKLTIQALHKMFTATGGVSAMEFGIAQGIDIAKKKTESPEVQNLINLDLGITDEQLKRKHKFDKGHSTETDAEKEQRELEESEQVEGFAEPPSGFSDSDIEAYNQMKKNYPNTTEGNANLFKKYNDTKHFSQLNQSQKNGMHRLFEARKKAGAFEHDTAEEAIDKSKIAGNARTVALQFNLVTSLLKTAKKAHDNKATLNVQAKIKRKFDDSANKYNNLITKFKWHRGFYINVYHSYLTKTIVRRHPQ